MARIYDISGFRIFSQGQIGRAHVSAHRALDQGQFAEGRRELGAWLNQHTGSGSDWVHIQWHMLVFELGVGAWHDAHQRFLDHILPCATDAATDAPAALWRLALSAPHPVDLPWNDVRDAALPRLAGARDHYVQLHNLLALAGACDTCSIERWLMDHTPTNEVERTLDKFARALCCFADAEYRASADLLEAVLPNLSRLGGSRGQNELFFQIHQTAAQRCAAQRGVRFDTSLPGNDSTALRAAG